MRPFSARPVIVASRQDTASANIAQQLIEHHGFVKAGHRAPDVYTFGDTQLVFVEKEGIHVQPEDLPAEMSTVIFASKHRSSTNTPALTVHTTGNLTGEAAYGGNPNQVSLVEPHRIRKALLTLKSQSVKEGISIDVTMEATHHGPTNLDAPVCFVEIGSGPSQWADVGLGRIAAKAVIAAATSHSDQTPNAVGFGGTHYNQKITTVCTDGDYQVGHIIPRHAFEAKVSDEVIHQAFRQTLGICKTAIVDWKGLKGEQRKSLLGLLSGWDIETVRC